MTSKFKVGDRVYLYEGGGKRESPLYLGLRPRRPRTIVAILYDPLEERNFYCLGSNARGVFKGSAPSSGYVDYLFRSYQLHRQIGKRGRPRRQKRAYNRRGASMIPQGS